MSASTFVGVTEGFENPPVRCTSPDDSVLEGHALSEVRDRTHGLRSGTRRGHCGARVAASASDVSPAATAPTVAQCVKIVKAQVHTKGKLTVATDSPAYPPWFVGNAPSNGKGYESAVAYASPRSSA